jgi:hypothetical protein
VTWPGPPPPNYYYGAPPPHPYGPYGAPAPWYPPPQVRKTSGWAVTSLVFGLLGGILLAVIAGIIGLRQTRGGIRSGRGMAIAGLALSAAWTLVLAFGLVLVLIDDENSVRATDLKPGDCIKNISSETRVKSVDKVSCDRRHDGEVFAVIPLIPLPSYPGEEDVQQHRNECAPLLREYAPLAATATIHLYYLYPTEGTWSRGDHSFTCVARFPGGRIGSIKE